MTLRHPIPPSFYTYKTTSTTLSQYLAHTWSLSLSLLLSRARARALSPTLSLSGDRALSQNVQNNFYPPQSLSLLLSLSRARALSLAQNVQNNFYPLSLLLALSRSRALALSLSLRSVNTLATSHVIRIVVVSHTSCSIRENLNRKTSIYEWVKPLMKESCHTWVSHVTRIIECSHAYRWVMSFVWMSHVTIRMRRFTHMNVPWPTYHCAMSHILMGHVTHVRITCQKSPEIYIITIQTIKMIHLLTSIISVVLIRFQGYFDRITRHSTNVIEPCVTHIKQVWQFPLKNAASPKSAKSKKLRFFGVMRYQFKLMFGVQLILYREIWVSRFGRFRGCSIFNGNC